IRTVNAIAVVFILDIAVIHAVRDEVSRMMVCGNEVNLIDAIAGIAQVWPIAIPGISFRPGEQAPAIGEAGSASQIPLEIIRIESTASIAMEIEKRVSNVTNVAV